MQKIITLAALAALTATSQAALTLTNSDFTNDGGDDTKLTGWTDALGSGTATIERIYHLDVGEGGAISAAAAFQARDGNYLQQSISTLEATADSFSTYNVSFLSGWRSNTAAPNDMSLRVSIWNVTDDTELGFANYTFSPNSPTNAFDTYQVIGTQTIPITYDNTAPDIKGNEIALRFTVSTSQNSFNPTAWIDDVTIEAVPEPSSAALLGLGAFAFILRRGK